MLWTTLGLTLIGLAIGRLLLGLIAAAQRVRAEAGRRELELAGLREELAAARAHRRRLAEDPLPWNGYRKFVVSRKTVESPSVCSFHLKPHDARPLPAFKPGQHLTFRLPGAAGQGPLVRCYSLSDRAHQGHYRVSIKRALPPPGAAAAPAGRTSALFHDVIREGDLLDVRAPAGSFCLDPAETDPVVLIGGGIGVTPLYSMLATLAQQRSRRTVWFFYGAQNRRELLFAAELAALLRDHPHFNVRFCLSRPDPGDRLGTDYHHAGRITAELLRRELPSSNFRFYYCGPGPMMEELAAGLKAWGVPETHLHSEAFGPLSFKRPAAAGGAAPAAGQIPLVSFRQSGRTLPWDGSCATLLDLAEQAGIAIPSGCRAGNCGTCAVAVQAGETDYLQPPGFPPEARTCLTCLARPRGDLVLEA